LTVANVQLLLPPEFNETKKYPVLIEVYGGPGSQLVTDKFRVNHWGSHLASNLSVIYARIDGRGSDNRGSKYLHEIYKNMGNVEVMDIITVARYSIFIFILFKFIINKTYFKVSSLFEKL
jgi:dipeptidyl-peptidase-4